MRGPLDLDPASFATLRGLLDEALDLPAGARAAWLAALPPEHAALHEPLARLLAEAAREEAGGAASPLDTLVPLGPPAAAPPPLPGDIGPWRPLRLLGEGGMGTVWLAERIDGLLRRPVALKLPRGAWRQAGLAERMAREREILGRLDHPHIARILDAGVSPDGQPWLALEYVEGVPIDRFCDEQRLGLRPRLQLFLQVARAVAHAHARLVVHRDLKPGNILVTADGQVRLLDFGIGKLLDADLDAPALTQQAGRLMTPWYASPEQVQGLPIGTASDVYALGVVLFELLTGQRPYQPGRASLAALEEAIVRGELPRPSSLAGGRPWARQLRGDLDSVVGQALKKDLAERYASADALADDIGHWLAHRPVSARPDTWAYRSRRFIARHRLGMAVAATVLLALSVALAGALWQREQARLEAAKANGIRDFLVSLFEANNLEQEDALRKRQQSVQDLLEQSAESLDTRLAGQPEVRDELQRVVSQLLNDLELTSTALRVRQQRVQALTAQDAPAVRQVDALRALAQSQYWSDDVAAARATLARAQALCPRAQDAPVCLGLSTDLGQLDFDERLLDSAEAHAAAAVAGLRRQAAGSAELAAALDLQGNVLQARNRSEPAYALMQEAMAIRRSLWGGASVRLAAMRYRLGRNLWAMRQLAQADQELRGALDTLGRALGPEHPFTLRVALDLGRLTAYVGLRPDGLPLLRNAAQQLLAHPERQAPSTLLEARTALGNVLLLDGELAQARTELAAALALRERQPRSERVADATLDQSWGRLLLDSGDYAGARAWLEDLRRRTLATVGPEHPSVADRQLRLAAVALAEGDLDQAGRLIDSASASQDAREASYGSPKHRAQLARAALLVEQGRFTEARPLIEAQVAAARRSPRADQYRDLVVQLAELEARLRCGLGQQAEGALLYEQAIAPLAAAHALHPALVAMRSRYALCLLDARQGERARQQFRLARQAAEAQPSLAPHLRRPLEAARLRLALSP